MSVRELVEKAREKADGSMLKLSKKSKVPIATLWRMWGGIGENYKEKNINRLKAYLRG